MRDKTVESWPKLAERGTKLVAIKCPVVDMMCNSGLLNKFYSFAQDLNLPLYYWNPGYGKQLQKLTSTTSGNSLQINPSEVNFGRDVDAIAGISSFSILQEGIFIVEGLIKKLDNLLCSQISNAFYELKAKNNQYLILVDDEFEVPLNLHPILPVLHHSFPGRQEVKEIIVHSKLFEGENLSQLVQACVGLPRGEIELVLNRSLAVTDSIESVTKLIMDYKVEKLMGRGIQITGEPDVPHAAGMDLVYETFKKIKKLLQPEAKLERNLVCPKGMLLWGIPGTGKSLVSKLAAQEIGATLVSCDWNGLVAPTIHESLANLDYIFDFCSEIGTCILFFDEFEKAFLGWDSGVGGGVLSKMVGKLLTWMQEHEDPTIMIATINRIESLSPELIRRFEYVFFFDLPHAGAMYEIFKLHLNKYFPGYSFEDNEWRVLFREYRGCTPAEIGKAVRHTAENIYYADRPAEVTLEDLLAERDNFKPASANQSTSDNLYQIRREADFAAPVCSKDTSRFAQMPQQMFQKPRELEENKLAPSETEHQKTPAIFSTQAKRPPSSDFYDI